MEQIGQISEETKINIPFYVYNSSISGLSIQRKENNTISLTKEKR